MNQVGFIFPLCLNVNSVFLNVKGSWHLQALARAVQECSVLF